MNIPTLEGAEACLAEARRLQSVGRLDEASTLFKRLLADLSCRAAALAGLGMTAIEAGSLSEAEIWLRDAVVAAPDEPWPGIHLSELLLRLARPSEALEFAQAAAGLPHAPSQALVQQAKCLRRLGDVRQARALLESAAEADPTNPWCWMELSRLRRDAGDQVGAEAAAHAMVRAAPDSPHALNILGEVLRDHGDAAGAQAAFMAATRLAPGDPWAWVHWGAMLLDEGEIQQACGIAERALAVAPSDPNVLLLAARCVTAMGEPERARELYQQAQAADPASPWPSIALARLLAAQDELEAAIVLLQGRPASPALLLALAELCGQAHRVDMELSTLHRATESFPDVAATWLALAACHWRNGAAEPAWAAAHEAQRRDPASTRPLEALANMAREARRPDEAERLLVKALQLNPSAYWSQLGLAHVLLNQGRIAELIALLEAAEQQSGARAGFAAMRVTGLRLVGRWPLALAAAEQDVMRFPADSWLREEYIAIVLRMRGPAAAAKVLAAAPPPIDRQEAAAQAHWRGRILEESWRLDDAARDYAQALRWDGSRRELLHDASRLALLRMQPVEARALLHRLVALDAAAARSAGLSTNPSQTHLGQLIDEVLLDAPLAASLAELRRQAPQDRLAPVASLVAAHPDSTAAAVQFLVTQREAGHLATAAPGAHHIPPRLCQYWSDAVPPDDVAEMMRSWADHHPGHCLMRYDTLTALGFLQSRISGAAAAAFRRASSQAMRADIFRLGWLFAEGGFYVDSDDRCHAALDSIVPAHADFLAYLEDYGTLGNNILGAAAGHPVIGAALAAAVAAVQRGDNDLVWLATGPALMARAMASCIVTGQGDPTRLPGGIAILDRAVVHRVAAMHAVAAYKTTHRHWNNSSFLRRRSRR